METKNKIIMECMIEYVQSKQLEQEILKQINFLWLKKQLALPFKLVGKDRIRPIESFREILLPSQLRWSQSAEIKETINTKQTKYWNDLIGQLLSLRIRMVVDFEPVKWNWRLSNDKQYLQIDKENGETTWYK